MRIERKSFFLADVARRRRRDATAVGDGKLFRPLFVLVAPVRQRALYLFNLLELGLLCAVSILCLRSSVVCVGSDSSNKGIIFI